MAHLSTGFTTRSGGYAILRGLPGAPEVVFLSFHQGPKANSLEGLSSPTWIPYHIVRTVGGWGQPDNRFRFRVRVVRAGEAKLRECTREA